MPHKKSDEVPWTPTEIENLNRLYPTQPFIQSLLEHFPGRTVNQVRCKARHLGLKRTARVGPQEAIGVKIAQAAYLAGLVDGEGTISLRTVRHPERRRKIVINPYVAIYNCVPEVLYWIHKTTELGHIRQRCPTKHQRKPVYEWITRSLVDCARISRTVLPYLIIKRRQAELLLEFCENRALWTTYTDHELTIVDKMRALNKRGI